MPQALDELIAKLEAAKTGSRELDCLVISHLIAGYAAVSPFNGLWCVYRGVDHRGEPRVWEPRDEWENTIYRATASDHGPTRSLDAALILSPSGANCYGFDASPNEVSAYWSRNSVATGHWIVESHHSHSVPIAFCIAALRRRATTGEDNG